mgnify:CR=1 FL=1
MKIAVLGYGNVARSLGIGWAKKGETIGKGVPQCKSGRSGKTHF